MSQLRSQFTIVCVCVFHERTVLFPSIIYNLPTFNHNNSRGPPDPPRCYYTELVRRGPRGRDHIEK